MKRHEIGIDNQANHFKVSDLPLLISGQKGNGVSFFSICLIYDLFHSGHKVLFFSAFPMAKDQFKSLVTGSEHDELEFVYDTGRPLAGKRAIILNSSTEPALLDALRRLPDIEERIIFIKNLEKYGPAVFAAIKEAKLLVLSGDLDRCAFVKDLLFKRFSTKIFFTRPLHYPVYDFIRLDKYEGLIRGDNYPTGRVRLGDDYYSKLPPPEKSLI